MATRASQDVVLLGGGDVGPVHPPVEKYSKLVAPVMAKGDIRSGNCERVYSTRGSLTNENFHGRNTPEMARVITDCHFDVVTLANNHAWDYGADALMDTKEIMEKLGVLTTGAGHNEEEARRPAVIERKGVKVAFLGYCSVLPEGGMVGPKKPGIVPMRADTYYHHWSPNVYSTPGMAPKVLTVPDKEDMDAMLADIAKAKKLADLVVINIHWGLIWIPKVMADYQTTVAHAAIDAGVDVVLGHHAHVPKAIEVYKGRPIYYSLSNFIMTKPVANSKWSEPSWRVGSIPSYTKLNPEYPLLPYGMDSRRTLIAKVTLNKRGVTRMAFLPMEINKEYQPEVLTRKDPRFDDAVRYMEWVSEGFNHSFRVEGDEVVVEG